MKTLMMTSYLGATLFALGLAGCGTAPEPVPITKYQNVLIAPTASMLVHCSVTAPPDPTVYVNSTDKAKEQLMRQNDAAQMTNLKTCNDRIDAVNAWIEQNLAIYSTDTSAVFVGRQPAVPVTASGVQAVAPSK